MNQTNKAILSFLLFPTIFIANASEELLCQLANETDPNRAQKKARMFLKGDKEKCIELFQKALKEGNPVAQIYLSNTRVTMRWAQDHKKDFSKGIQEEQLESYNVSRIAMDQLECTHKEASPRLPQDSEKTNKIAHRTVDQAEKTGNLYAKFLQILEKKDNYLPNWHFGLACKLKPLIDQKQFSELLFSFGASLRYWDLQFELEGLKYMEKSGLLNFKFFEDDQKNNFSYNFNDYCTTHTERWHSFRDKYGMRFIEYNTILVPSKEYWANFKKEKLETVQSSPDQLFNLFEKHNMDQIHDLVKKYKLYFFHSKYNFLPYLNIKSDVVNELNGEIRLTDTESKNTSVNIQLPSQSSQQKIIENLDPVINFLRDALSRCRDINTVCAIMCDLELEYDPVMCDLEFEYDPVLNPDLA